MAAVNIDALRRQLENRRNGVTRRRVLIDDALRKVDRLHSRATVARAKLDDEIAALEAERGELLALRERHGVSRQKGQAGASDTTARRKVIASADLALDLARRQCASGPEVLVIDQTFPQRLTTDAMIWETPLAFPEGEVSPVPRSKVPSDDTTFGRAVSIPGFPHLGYLVQAQWMTGKPLANAAALSETRGNHGEALAPDLIGHVVDGKAAGAGGTQFWKARGARAADDEGTPPESV